MERIAPLVWLVLQWMTDISMHSYLNPVMNDEIDRSCFMYLLFIFHLNILIFLFTSSCLYLSLCFSSSPLFHSFFFSLHKIRLCTGGVTVHVGYVAIHLLNGSGIKWYHSKDALTPSGETMMEFQEEDR